MNKLPILLITSAIFIFSTNAHANTNQQKINIVKKIYQEANQGKNWDNILLKYADNKFKSRIQNRTYCDADALWGNQDPQTPTKVSVISASNGRVKATFKQYGQTEVNHFTFTCKGSVCKVSNVELYSCE